MTDNERLVQEKLDNLTEYIQKKDRLSERLQDAINELNRANQRKNDIQNEITEMDQMINIEEINLQGLLHHRSR